MNKEEFVNVFHNQVDRCNDILVVKAKEYATDDRLHNFKVAAKMMGTTPEQALAGFMAKHTVSIYDMCRDINLKEFPIDIWEEKITDHINYLILLRALVEERYI